MRDLLPETLEALASGYCGLAQLVHMELSAPLRVNTSAWNLTWNGGLYLGAGLVGAVSAINETAGELQGVEFTLSAVPVEMLSLALQEPMQGKLVTVYTAIFDAPTSTILEAALEWQGRLDVPRIEETGDTASISVSAEHIGIDLLRPSNLLYTHQDQQRLYLGDRGFEHVAATASKDIVWPARSFFQK